MHILISPNAFKNSLDAEAAAIAIAKGLLQSNLTCRITLKPIGDGGDGTGVLLTKALDGIVVEEAVSDPLGRKIKASFGWIEKSKTAIIELASASGLRLLTPEEYDPLRASSYGTGELIKHALDKGAGKIVLCVGGSATVDGGCGILQALGVRFLDAKGNILINIPEQLPQLDKVDLSEIDPRIHTCECTILCDVSNPLLGETGAAKIFGPQKGASAADVTDLENSLAQFSRIIQKDLHKDISSLQHGGAAGGVSAGLFAVINAKLVQGIDEFLDITGYDAALAAATLVITGEGSIDQQTLEGKAPFGVAVRARKRNIPVVALAGKIPDPPVPELQTWFNRILNINEGFEGKDALAETARNLGRTAKQLGKELAAQQKDQ